MSNNNYRLLFTVMAERDLDDSYNYITTRLFANLAAENLMDKIETSIIRLTQLPFSCGFVLDETLKNRGYRKLIVDNYIVFYLVNEEEKQVVIMRILYGASNYQDIL